jgi:hypothetical protein
LNTEARRALRSFEVPLCLCVSVFSWRLPCWRGRPLVYRLLAWRWPVAGPGFPSGSNSGLRSVFSLRPPAAWSGFEATSARRGISWRSRPLLSGIRDELRKPAQHKNGFPSREEGNPVERANSRNRPGRPGGAAYWPRSLQRWCEHHAPARPRRPGVGKVLRKVPIRPPRVNPPNPNARQRQPLRAGLPLRFRTREGGGGLTAIFPNRDREEGGGRRGRTAPNIRGAPVMARYPTPHPGRASDGALPYPPSEARQ